MKPAEIRNRLNFVELSDGPHLYWKHTRLTLCHRDKRYAQTLWWAPVDCEKCLAKVGEITMKDTWPAMEAAMKKAA